METKAAIIRDKLLATDMFGEQPLANTLSEAMGQLLEGAEQLWHPRHMQTVCHVVMSAYAQLWGDEHRAAVIQALGSKTLFMQICRLPNCGIIVERILGRITAKYGQLRPGMTIDVAIDDILLDEIGDLPGYCPN